MDNLTNIELIAAVDLDPDPTVREAALAERLREALHEIETLVAEVRRLEAARS